MSKVKAAPKSKAEERAFWETNDSSDYVDWTKAQSVSLPNLKPSTKTISLRLPEGLLGSINSKPIGAICRINHLSSPG
jgi:hypothetical protein